jgi:hypothetical protein
MTAGPQFLGHTVFNHLLGEVKASVVSVALLAEPVGATLLGLLVFHERPGPQVVPARRWCSPVWPSRVRRVERAPRGARERQG